MIAAPMGLGKPHWAASSSVPASASVTAACSVCPSPTPAAQSCIWRWTDPGRSPAASPANSSPPTGPSSPNGSRCGRAHRPPTSPRHRRTRRAGRRRGADTVVLDSVKDGAVGLKEDEVGAGYNRARQKLIAAGVEVLQLHHTTKRNAQGGAPDSVADIFGSAWITAGTGSIILLSGDPGDPVVGFQHIRQPAEEVGPWQLLHDQTSGKITIHHETDPVAMALASGEKGVTADDLVDSWDPDKKLSGRSRLAAREKARRVLNKLVDQKKLTRVDGTVGGGAMRRTTSWFPAI